MAGPPQLVQGVVAAPSRALLVRGHWTASLLEPTRRPSTCGTHHVHALSGSCPKQLCGCFQQVHAAHGVALWSLLCPRSVTAAGTPVGGGQRLANLQLSQRVLQLQEEDITQEALRTLGA